MHLLNLNYIEEELKELDPNKPSDINKYAEVKSQKDVADIAKEYTEISWQADVIETIIAPVIGEINNYKYVDKNENKLADSTIKYNEMFKALKESNWKYFANKELENINLQIKQLNLLIEEDKENVDLQLQLKSLELQKEVVTLRLEKDIKYGSEDYKSSAIQYYKMYMENYNQYAQSKNITEEEKSEINLAIRIFVLLYGLTNNNFTVPLLNSSLTETPATITITITIITIYDSIEF